MLGLEGTINIIVFQSWAGLPTTKSGTRSVFVLGWAPAGGSVLVEGHLSSLHIQKRLAVRNGAIQ